MCLNIEFIEQEWIPALRSGEYKQGKSHLHTNDTFCCLGVACDLLMNRGLLTKWKKRTVLNKDHESDTVYYIDNLALDMLSSAYPYHRRKEDTCFFPERVSRYLGVDSADIEVKTVESGIIQTHTSLIQANDNGASFEQIADALEEFVREYK